MSRSCNLCGKHFSKPALLKRHQVVHTKVNLYNCENCSCSFSQKSSLQRHQLRKHEANNLTPESRIVEQEKGEEEVAQQTLAALINLQTVQKSQSNVTLEEKPMVRGLVDIRDTLRPKTADGHQVALLRTQLIQRSLPGGNRSYYVCEFCAKEFSKTYDLIRHRRIHTKEKPYPCLRNNCFKRFATQSKLREHEKILKCGEKLNVKKFLQPKPDKNLRELKPLLPQPLQNNPSLGGSFRCVYCRKIFTRKYNCRIHMLTHLRHLSNSKTVTPLLTGLHFCSHCGKSFKKSHDLARHLLIHSKIKSFSCHLCKKVYTLKATLSRHLLTHQSDRLSFNCQVCAKSFMAQSSLNLHLRLHTGERPFRCEICQETFRTSGHRLEHMRGERHKTKKKIIYKKI